MIQITTAVQLVIGIDTNRRSMFITSYDFN